MPAKPIELRVPLISLRDVEFSYSRRTGLFGREENPVLRSITFDVFAGETLALVGRNGVGKSTLMQLLAGIVAPDAGRIEMNGVRTSLLSLRLGFVRYLTGRENARLSGLLLGVPRRQIEESLEGIAAFSELGSAFDHPIATYSSGMAARLAFSVAFVAEPDVLLIDEVWAVGDAGCRAKARARMEQLVRSDKTVVLVSQAENLIRNFADRAIWIEDGAVRLQGSPSSVVDTYLEAQSR